MNDIAIVTHRSHIDDVLGESSTRYFGGGFRKVNHRIYNVEVDTIARTGGGLAEIRYPSEWSKKRSRELQPHLSTLDSMTIAAELAELYLRHAYGLGPEDARRCWIRRAVMKASSTPTTDLGRVPVSIALERTGPVADSRCGHLSELTCLAGSMTVELVVDHPVIAESRGSAAWAAIDDALGSSERRHYVSGYKSTNVVLTDIVAESIERAAATMTLQPAIDRGAETIGLSADYEPFVSMMYALIAAAQMSQVVLYQCDHITRETSNNMWLRRLSMEMVRAVPVNEPFQIQTWITKTSVVPMKGSRWRSASFITTFPGLQMEYNLAHELAAPEERPDSAPEMVERAR